MSNLVPLATRYTRRPLLMLPSAAEDIVSRLQLGNREVRSEGFVEAALRKIGLGRDRSQAMFDADLDGGPWDRPEAYQPLWAQQLMGDPEDEVFCWSLYRGIALMEVANALTDRGESYCGTWYHGYDTILTGLKTAAADSRVKAIFVRMDTPGGVVAPGITELSAWIRANRAAAGGKPIWFWCSMSCSAGLWISSGGDRMLGGRHSLIGSIGAAYVHYDLSEAYAKAGIKVDPIIFGPGKVDGAQFAALSAAARADLQAEIDQVGRDFVADVVAGRSGLTAEGLIATQARVFIGQHDEDERSALGLGLIDEVLTEQEAFEALLSDVSSPLSPPSAGSPGAMAFTPQKETPMATTPKAGGQKPKAETDKTPQAEGGEGGAAPSNEDDEEEDETDAPPASKAEGEDEEATKAAAEARKISASAEAKANPQMALAAINSGMSFDQFKAAAAVSPEGAKASKSSPLADAMAGVQRVGADAQAGGQKGLGDLLVQAAGQVRK